MACSLIAPILILLANHRPGLSEATDSGDTKGPAYLDALSAFRDEVGVCESVKLSSMLPLMHLSSGAAIAITRAAMMGILF
jgi:hypothetical protein